MIRRLLYLIVCLLPFMAVGQATKMTTSEVNVFQRSLQQFADIKTLQADFVQYKHMSFMKRPMESSGKLYVSNPDKLSWSYTNPFQYKMVFRDNKVFINDQGKKSTINVGNKKQFEKISKLVSAGMRGGKYDEKEFAVSYYKQQGNNLVKLTPKLKDAKKYIKEIVLTFDAKDKQVQEVKLIEPSNDYTRFVLKNRKINVPLHDSVFNL